jgi:hypothetical protein
MVDDEEVSAIFYSEAAWDAVERMVRLLNTYTEFMGVEPLELRVRIEEGRWVARVGIVGGDEPVYNGDERNLYAEGTTMDEALRNLVGKYYDN